MSAKKNRKSNKEPGMPCEILPYKEQLSLFQKYKETGDTEAFHKLVESNMRLAYKIADGFNSERFREDLRSEAIAALIFAIERWDPSRGVLTTIATPIIRQRLTRFLVENSYAVRIPYLTFRASALQEDGKDFSPITGARYLSNRESCENEQEGFVIDSHCSVEEEVEKVEEDISLRQKLDSVEAGYRILFELIHGIHEDFTVKASLQQLSKMLNVSKSKLKTRINLVVDYIKEPAKCCKCGKEFFRKNKRAIYCSDCRSFPCSSSRRR